jgi:Protein of unknown function (DUF3631)
VTDSGGRELLDELHRTLARFVILPSEEAADAVVLWIAGTHVLAAFQTAARLAIKSPEKRCGKSRLLDIVAGTCHAPLMSVNATVPAIFRSIGNDEGDPPTLLIDEADTLWGTKRAAENNEDLRALVNAGHQRGRPALRCVGPQQIPTEFATFAMVALAGIGDLPDTITDRAVNITMRRRKPGEKVSPYRQRRDGPVLDNLRDRLEKWGASAVSALVKAEPDMPVEDRAADTWEPLVAIADHVGGDWPRRARTACRVLVEQAESNDEEQSLSLRLLGDVRSMFTVRDVNFLSSNDLVKDLRRIDEAPWDSLQLDTYSLAHRLKEFEIKPSRNSAGTARGYRLADCMDAFGRYLRQTPSEPSDTPPEQEKPSDAFPASDDPPRQTLRDRQTETAAQPLYLTDLTDPDGSPADEELTRTCADCQRPVGPGIVRCSRCYRAATWNPDG